jgi:hypothetical protein
LNTLRHEYAKKRRLIIGIPAYKVWIIIGLAAVMWGGVAVLAVWTLRLVGK